MRVHDREVVKLTMRSTSPMSRPSSPILVATRTLKSPCLKRLMTSRCCFCFIPWAAMSFRTSASSPPFLFDKPWPMNMWGRTSGRRHSITDNISRIVSRNSAKIMTFDDSPDALARLKCSRRMQSSSCSLGLFAFNKLFIVLNFFVLNLKFIK